MSLLNSSSYRAELEGYLGAITGNKSLNPECHITLFCDNKND
jgi:hypothetical protein